MKMLKKFFVLFLVMSLSAGVLLSLPFALRQGISATAVRAFSYGILAGFIMILVFMGFYFVANRLTPSEQRDLLQRRELLITGGLPRILDQCYQLLKSERFVKRADLDEGQGIITAKTRFSWACPGEKITIQFSAEDGRSRIVITSQPLWRTTMVDYGKNFKNVEALQKLFRDRLGTTPL